MAEIDRNLEEKNIDGESEEVLARRIAGTQALAAFSEGIGQLFVHLESQTKRVDTITQTIDEIAEQINILSINASIEAALAGDKGKGFAVLAGEVRELAASATEATSDTRKVLNGIKKEIANVGQQIEESKTLAATELAGIEEARAGLRAMSDSMGAISGVVEEFADQAGSQLKNAEELVQGQNEAVASISTAAAELAKLSEQLYSGMSNFGGMQSGAESAKDRIQEAQQELQEYSEKQAIMSLDPEAMQIAIAPLAEKYVLAFVADKNGDMKASTRETSLENIAFRGYFKQARSGKPFVSSVYISSESNLPCVTIALPVKRDAEVVGVLGADLELVVVFDDLKGQEKDIVGVGVDIGVETF